MKKLLPVILLAACAILGGGLGFAAKIFAAPTTKEKGSQDADPSRAEQKTGHESGKDARSHGKGGHNQPAEAAFLKFSRQFVVPANADGRRMLVIVDLNVELNPDVAEQAYALEPKLRDQCLAVLLDFGAQGRLAEVMSSASEAAAMKSALLQAVRSILGEGAVNVLITDIAVQESAF
jgi:flagellar basal body-associated protein FliL